jgi:hypothetical protein
MGIGRQLHDDRDSRNVPNNSVTDLIIPEANFIGCFASKKLTSQTGIEETILNQWQKSQ